MPTTTRETVLSRYRYDPLDRLSTQTDIARFYCNNRLATEVGGGVQTSLFQHDDQLLAQRQVRADKIDTTLLATDQQRSVLNALDATRPYPIAYSPYGHRPPENGLLSLLGFNGERPDSVTGHYHLGNGYRQFNPVLMRFNSPDSWSPFGRGGLNAYAYCDGEPVLGADPTGHSNIFMSAWKGFKNTFLGRIPKKLRTPTTHQDVVFNITHEKQGMRYNGQTLGYQVGKEETMLNLNKKSIKEIETYTKAVETDNNKLLDQILSFAQKTPDTNEKFKVVRSFYEESGEFRTDALSTPKDIAVRDLHSKVMYSYKLQKYRNYFAESKINQPSEINSELRKLS
ncbi:RHS repeat-associated core domain-containing protein [Pseudomonas sp. Sample_24]|uniref:RHS repeat-associated core domain-containing protein n=1 Tax=Pseudomonas sp. Sample_24 TaxID=2448268 RepID=UPI001032F1F7|nr:RHS repeat-associated core domain-containing protein [Pseudomonas sp. Sample_24]